METLYNLIIIIIYISIYVLLYTISNKKGWKTNFITSIYNTAFILVILFYKLI